MLARSWVGASDLDLARTPRVDDRPRNTLTRGDVVVLRSEADPIEGLADSVYAGHWVRDRLRPLTLMTTNWDSYGGRALDPAVAEAAEELLVPLLLQGVPAPSLVPTSGGGLGLEWHRPDMELVIHLVAAANPFHDATVFYWDGIAGTERESQFSDGTQWLGSALARLTQPVRP